ncbi:MAG: YraN family protein [Planctomycetota bacterium]
MAHSTARSWLQGLRERYMAIRFGAIDRAGPIGFRGEQVAARMLRQKRYTIISHGETDRGGEIDLIAVDPQRTQLIFVEVKTLATTKPGHPAERVDENKQRRLTEAALRYLRRKGELGIPCRFDVVAVWWPSGDPRPIRVEHYEAAFEAAGRGQLY